MELAPLQPLIRDFVALGDDGPDVAVLAEAHARRRARVREMLEPDRITHLMRADLEALFTDTEAWATQRGRGEFWRRLLGEHDERLVALRGDLANLVVRGQAGIQVAGFRHFLEALPGMGAAMLAEVLALRFPERYWTSGAQVRDFLKSQGVDVKQGLPYGKKGDPAEEYAAIGRHLQPLRRALEHAARGDVDFLTVDRFVHWVNRKRRPTASGPVRNVDVPEGEEQEGTRGAEGVADAVLAGVEVPSYSLEQLGAETFLGATFWSTVAFVLEQRKQVVLHGPPGTGKTFAARLLARYWVTSASDPHGHVAVMSLHPSFTYEQFMEGPGAVGEGGAAGRPPVRRGLFRALCEEARMHPERRYVLVLDEMGRCDLPRVLGDLLYLLEYREESAVLPYSGEVFSVPPNLYLVGCLNTAGRSALAQDHGLWRRFHLVPMPPNPEVLRSFLVGSGQPDVAWLSEFLRVVNARLVQDGVGWQQHIGHCYFMGSPMDEMRIRLAWEHDVLPVLGEYFQREPQRLKGYDLEMLCAGLGAR